MIQIPAITLTAIGSGRRFALHQLGVPAVLLYFWLDTAELGPPVNREIRRSYPTAARLITANVADLRGVPALLRGLAEYELRKGYQRVVSTLPAGVAPEDYVIILPDWKGQTCQALAIHNLKSAPALAVLDKNGQVVGTYQGMELSRAALGLLSKLEQ
jgi:hypothetical protein